MEFNEKEIYAKTCIQGAIQIFRRDTNLEPNIIFLTEETRNSLVELGIVNNETCLGLYIVIVDNSPFDLEVGYTSQADTYIKGE